MHLLRKYKLFLIIPFILIIAIPWFFNIKKSKVAIEVYRKAIYSIPDKFDTHVLVSTSEHTISHLIYEGLFTVNEYMDTKPSLVSEWSIDSSKTTYTFKIKNNIYFSDGTLLTLEDVKSSLDSLYMSDSPVRDMFKNIREISIANNSLVILIESPNPSFISLLTSPFAKIYKNIGNDPYPVGTGPFSFSNINQSSSGKKVLTLVKNTKYREAIFIDKLELWELTEPEALKLVKDGFIHDTSIYLSVGGKYKNNSKVKETFSPAAVTWLFPLNTKNKFLKDIKLRKCLTNAFDRKEFIDKFRPDHNIADGFLPATLLGGSSKLHKESFKDLNCNEFKGVKLAFDIPIELGEQVTDICNYVTDSYKNIGIKIKCNPVKFSNLVSRIQNGSSEISFMAQTLDYPDVEYFFTTYESNSHFNISNYTDKFIDKLLNDARFSQDRFKKNEIYHNLNQYLNDKYLTINISYPNHISYRHSCVTDFKVNIIGETYIDYKKIGLISDCDFSTDFREKNET